MKVEMKVEGRELKVKGDTLPSTLDPKPSTFLDPQPFQERFFSEIPLVPRDEVVDRVSRRLRTLRLERVDRRHTAHPASHGPGCSDAEAADQARPEGIADSRRIDSFPLQTRRRNRVALAFAVAHR